MVLQILPGQAVAVHPGMFSSRPKQNIFSVALVDTLIYICANRLARELGPVICRLGGSQVVTRGSEGELYGVGFLQLLGPIVCDPNEDKTKARSPETRSKRYGDRESRKCTC